MQTAKFDSLNFRRRVFETPGYHTTPRYIVKRTVPSSERQDFMGDDRLDPRDTEMLRNEVLAIEYVRQHTTIPVPTIITVFDDRDSIYMVQEFVEGTVNAGGTNLPPFAQAKIKDQLAGYIAQLHALTDPHLRSFIGAPLFPHRFAANRLALDHAEFGPSPPREPYVLCHGDLGWQNVLVDPITFEIKCVIDWEFAGFYLVMMEGDKWERQGWFSTMSETRPESGVEALVGTLYGLAVGPAPPRDGGDSGGNGLGSAGTPASPLTATQTQLRKLDIGLPPSRAVTSATLAVQTVIAAHRGVAQDMLDTSTILEDAYSSVMATFDPLIYAQRADPKDRPLTQRFDLKYYSPLSRDLPKMFATLASAYKLAAESYIPLRDRLFDLADAARSDELDSRSGAAVEEVPVEADKIRRMADQAYKDMETVKWAAIATFARALLVHATAAQSLFPFLPDTHTAPSSGKIDKERFIAEKRVQLLRQGGSRGWRVVVEEDAGEVARIREQGSVERGRPMRH